ncbi:MAG: efflux RND transporter periplasmic adaptor subunit [Thiogranum sp.]|nr:efflux RND transporter periplasmic adaptor subunit [Thiogranum sp.]
MQEKGWMWTALVVLLVAGLSYAAYEALRPAALPTGFLYGNGHIEGTEVAVSAEIAGRVVESHAVEGVAVSEGDLLVRLDDRELQARLAQAQAALVALEHTQARFAQELETWQHHLATAREDLERFRTLRRSGTVTPHQLNESEDRYRETDGRVKVLQAQRKETQAREEAARQQVRVLRLQLARTEIRAPISGTVLTRAIEVGELATEGRVVAVLVDLSRLDLKVYIPERDIGKVELGLEARVRVDAFPERYFEAVVGQVDQQAQFTPRDIHLPEERIRMVFGVKLALDNPGGVLKPGMPADAWIRWAEGTPWPEQLVIPQ